MAGVGKGMPVFAAPLVAVLAGVVFAGGERALTAYVAGTTGVLLGADILRIGYIRRIGAATASIGGAPPVMCNQRVAFATIDVEPGKTVPVT